MEEKLIEYVREHEFLYNKNHKNHKNVLLRDKAFAELSKKINVPVKKLKDRWRTLRDRFHKEMKGPTLPSGPRKKWKFLDDLEFLKNGYTSNPKTSRNFPIYNQNSICAESFEAPSPRTDATGQTTLSDDILDVMEDILGDVNNGISKVVKTAKDVLVSQTERKTAAQLFFESIATQTDEAELSATEFTHLQIQILSIFNKFLIERQKVKTEI